MSIILHYIFLSTFRQRIHIHSPSTDLFEMVNMPFLVRAGKHDFFLICVGEHVCFFIKTFQFYTDVWYVSFRTTHLSHNLSVVHSVKCRNSLSLVSQALNLGHFKRFSAIISDRLFQTEFCRLIGLAFFCEHEFLKMV